MNSSTPLPHETADGSSKIQDALEFFKRILFRFGHFEEAPVKHEATAAELVTVPQYSYTLNEDSGELSVSRKSNSSLGDETDQELTRTTGGEEKNLENPLRGSYGRIATMLYKGTVVAVKTITPCKELQFTLDDCTREKDLLQHLNQTKSPYIVRYLACNYSPPDFHIMMEYVPGKSLSSYIRSNSEQPFEWQIRYKIMEQLTEGIVAMHGLDILHRDIKPENILLGNLTDPANIIAKFCDFGSGKFLNTQIEPNTTTFYMAPELMSLDEPQSSKKSEIYTLGTLFWVLAAWDPKPYNNMLIIKVIEEVRAGKRLAIPETTPRKFSHLIKWCWQDDAELRPTAAELLTEIKTGLDVESESLSSRFAS